MEYMDANIPGCETELIDALKYINTGIDRLITGTYLQAIKKAPWIYRKLYALSERNGSVTSFAKTVSGLLSSGLAGIFADRPPDAVICAHTIPLQMVSKLKRAGIIDVPVIAVVTDYAGHGFWNLKEADAFIVAHENIRSDLADRDRCKSHLRIRHTCLPRFTNGSGTAADPGRTGIMGTTSFLWEAAWDQHAGDILSIAEDRPRYMHHRRCGT